MRRYYASNVTQRRAAESDIRRAAGCSDPPAVALMLIDVINDLNFSKLVVLLQDAPQMAHRPGEVKGCASEKRMPSIYVSDNFGQWKSDFRQTAAHCARSCPGPMTWWPAPTEADYFVRRPKYSGLCATSLDLILEDLGTRTLISIGIAGGFCVLFTANDSYMCDYRIYVPSGCVASNTEQQER
jgi:nicotinamidase-related amidase